MTPQRKLRAALSGPDILVAPGIYDAFGAMLADKAGFPALYLSGASIAYTRLGRPDIGLVGMDEVAEVIGLIRERVDAPLIVDADTGYGNALNVQRTVRVFERRGASVIQLEDQRLPKRCGHLDGKELVTAEEMAGKVRAALDARHDPDTIIMARTDAIAVEGLSAALDRAEAYLEAGAEVLFIEAPRDDDEIAAVVGRFGGRVPLLANMVEGGRTPVRGAGELQALGYAIVIFPGGMVRTIACAAERYFKTLREEGTTMGMRGHMLDFQAINALVDTEGMLETGRRYDRGDRDR